MHDITPHFWFNTEALRALEFYTSIFPHAKIIQRVTISGVPSPGGDCDIVSFEIAQQPFMAINAGPLFKPNPSISFFLNFDPSRDKNARAQLDALWSKLAEGGNVLMPLQEYPFSKHYGWVQDKFGISWQLILSDPKGEPRPFIVPSLLFVGDVCGKAKEATDFYMSVFKNSKRGQLATYPAGMEPDEEGSVMFTDFMINGQWFAAMDSAHEHKFAFGEAISLLIPCNDQAEIDYFWEKLSADKSAEQCGWLKDKYGVSWQVSPVAMEEMLAKGTPEQIIP
jgi:predicted 3-demethylubiquinone-9 3-methyltransferase (glyoxalase superfamily)